MQDYVLRYSGTLLYRHPYVTDSFVSVFLPLFDPCTVTIYLFFFCLKVSLLDFLLQSLYLPLLLFVVISLYINTTGFSDVLSENPLTTDTTACPLCVRMPEFHCILHRYISLSLRRPSVFAKYLFYVLRNLRTYKFQLLPFFE